MAWGNQAGVGNLLETLGQLQGIGHWLKKGNSKGKGMPKGKGKGKGWAASPDTDDTCFQCLWDDCQAATGKQVTWGKPCCHKCGRAKGTAKSPPIERVVQWQYDWLWLQQQQKKQLAADSSDKENSDKGKNKAATTSRPRTQAAVADAEQLAELRAERMAGLKEAAAASPAAAGSPSLAPSSATPPARQTGKKVGSTLSEGALESAPLLTTLIRPVLDLVEADWVAEVPTGLDPEVGLKNLLQSSTHLSTADGKEALEASLAESRKLLDTAASPALRKCLQAQIDSDAAALERLAKKASPSLATQLAALQEAEKTLLRQSGERKDKEAAGRQKAITRGDTRREFFQEVRHQLAIIESAVEAHEEQWSSVHAAKSQVLEGYEKAMLARLQTRIVAAESPDDPGRATARETEAEAQKTACAAADDAEAAKAKAEAAAADASAKHTELLRQIETLQAEAKKAEALQKQALTTQQAELVFATAGFSMIPKDVAPKTGEKTFWKICGHLYQLLERWHYGGTISVTLAELSAHSLAKDTTQSLMLKLLGPQLWQGWFGQSDFRMVNDSVLPRQTLMFLYYALQQLKDHYEGVEDTRTAAAQSYASMVEASTKKRRTLA